MLVSVLSYQINIWCQVPLCIEWQVVYYLLSVNVSSAFRSEVHCNNIWAITFIPFGVLVKVMLYTQRIFIDSFQPDRSFERKAQIIKLPYTQHICGMSD